MCFSSYLEEVAVTAIEFNLNGDIRAVADSRDTKTADVEWNAGSTLAGGLEELYREWELNTRCRGIEDREVSRILLN